MWDGNLIFNQDYTQLLVGSTDGWYIVQDGAAEVKLIDGKQKISMLIPEYTFTNSTYLFDEWDEAGIFIPVFPSIMYGTESLLDQFYYNQDGTLYYFNKDGEVVQLEEDITDVQISKSGRYIYYIKNNQLYYRMNSNLSTPVLVVDGVSTFIIQEENKIYYKDLSNTLFYKNGTEEAKKVADNVYAEVLTYDGYVLFLTEYSNNEGTLNYSKNGSEKTFIAENVCSIKPSGGATYYCADSHRETGELGIEELVDVYVITQNMGTKLLLDDMKRYSDGIAIHQVEKYLIR